MPNLSVIEVTRARQKECGEENRNSFVKVSAQGKGDILDTIVASLEISLCLKLLREGLGSNIIMN